jgi:long-chain acyl-CoA synthetase
LVAANAGLRIARRLHREDRRVNPLLDQFESVVRARREHTAVSDPALTLRYEELRAVAGGLAGQIPVQTRKQNVGILAPTSSAGAAAIFASWYAGKTPVPLNFLLAPEELAKVIRDADIDLIMTVEHFAPMVARTGLQILKLDAQTLVPKATGAPAARPEDVAVVLYTSGTSGDPKGVCLTFDNLVRNANACIQCAEIRPEQPFLSVLPQFHSFGFTALTITPLIVGATGYYLPRFSPATIAALIAEKQIRVFMAIASMWAALAMLKNAAADTFRSLRLAVSGGEPLPERVARAFRQRFDVTILEGYGLTESSPVATLNTPAAHRDRSVGRPIPGVDISIVDEEGRNLPPGRDGEIVIRGHCVMKEYRNKPRETAAAIRDGGLHTGDMGRVDPDGFVYITGRIKEMMIVGGENVFPIEIESALLEHPAVAEVAVIGVRDDVRGETPVAFVILKEGAAALDRGDPATAAKKSADVSAKEGAATMEVELRNFCRDRLAGYKVPRQVFIRTDLPRGPTGKILKRALAAQLPAED